MKHLLTVLLGGLVLALGAHLLIAIWWPPLIAEHYPSSIARLYAGKSGTGKREEIARLTPISGRPGVSSITLTPLAVEKLGIETTVVEAAPTERIRSISGVVLSGQSLPLDAPAVARAAALVVVVPLSGKTDQPAPNMAAEVVPLAGMLVQAPAKGPTAVLWARPAGVADQGAGSARQRAAYYVIEAANVGLEPGDAVTVRMPLGRSGEAAVVLPASAVLYEPNGTTWVYTSPEPQVFVREQLHVEAMSGGRAILKSGPPPGTRVVTVGAFELYGAESSIGLEKAGR